MKYIIDILILLLLISCVFPPVQTPKQEDETVPIWVNDLERAFPSRDWVRVPGEAKTRAQAENSVISALAQTFRTDVESLTQASQRYSQFIREAGGIKDINFEQSQNFEQMVTTGSRVRGLIGVQIDTYLAPNSTVYACARMNRRECAARYSGMIRENTANINRLLALAASAPEQGTFEVYSRLSFAHAIAQETDNFQNILEVLDPSAINNRPSYGSANAIKIKMLECAARITIGITINTEKTEDRNSITRAASSFFTNLGFRINEQGSFGQSSAGNYVLRANVRFEEQRFLRVIHCYYYLDAALENRNRTALFAHSDSASGTHVSITSEARRNAVQAVEVSFKEGKFAQNFNTWLNSLLE